VPGWLWAGEKTPGSLTLRHKGTVCGDDEYAPIISYLILSYLREIS
jgi:hypothetical protein